MALRSYLTTFCICINLPDSSSDFIDVDWLNLSPSHVSRTREILSRSCHFYLALDQKFAHVW